MYIREWLLQALSLASVRYILFFKILQRKWQRRERNLDVLIEKEKSRRVENSVVILNHH